MSSSSRTKIRDKIRKTFKGLLISQFYEEQVRS